MDVSRDITEHRARDAEQKLRKSEEMLREAQRMAHLGSWDWNVKTGEVSWSDETYRIYGYEPGEFVPTLDTLMEIVHPDDRELVRKNLNDALHKGEPYDFEHRVVRPNGEERIVRRQAEVVFDEEGEPLRMIGTVHDITERKEAEKALKESEERYRALVEESAESIFVFEADTRRVLEANTAFQRLVGYASEELLEMTIYDFLAHEWDEIDSNVRRDLRERRRFAGEQKYRRKDGSLLDVETSMTVIPYQGREAICAVARDLSKRKQAEAELRFQKTLLEAQSEASIDGIVVISGGREIISFNRRFVEMWGIPEDVMATRSVEAMLETVQHKLVDPQEFMAGIAYLYEHPDEERLDEIQLNDGRTFDRFTAPVKSTEGTYYGRVWYFRDVTESKRTEETLRQNEERYRAVVERTTDGIFLGDFSTNEILESNAALQDMLGYTSEELRGMSLYDLIADNPESIDRNTRRIQRGESFFIGERRYRRKDGSLVNVEVSATRIPYGEKEASCCIVRDVTERKVLEEQLRHQALHDSLTGLPNRALFLDRLEHGIARARRGSGSVAVLFADLDDFKIKNDSLGHDAGNALLDEVAERLRGSVRPGDTVARIFGDEFAVLLEAPARLQEAQQVAERVVECFRKPFVLRGREVYISSSIGIALGESDEENPQEVLGHADLAMYAAKSRGKAHHQIYEPNMEGRAAKRVELESDLRRAIECEEFTVYYQPKVLLGPYTNRIASVEALVRWEHPERGLLPPREFISVAEEAGLIAPLGRWVLREACQQARRWKEQYPSDPPLAICVNLSAKQFRLSNLHEEVAQVLRETGLEAPSLHLEITEAIAMEDVQSTITTLRRLKDLGVRLTMKDFGMGYSSLSYLDRFPVDILKVAKSFVSQLTKNPEGTALVSAIVNLGRALNLTTIAEGVENAQQLIALKKMGCDMAQGYYFAEPCPPEAVGELLARGALPQRL